MEDLFKICGIVNLKKGEGRTIKAGGMWVYDNEIESIMGDAPDGTLVEVHDFDGYFMGIGFINRRSKLTVRMMSRHQHVIDEDFIEQRLYYKNIRKLVNNNSRKEISLTKYKTA